MAIKVLFFDTSVVIKLFIKEKGSNTLNWLASNKVKFSLRFVINEQVCSEFLNKIKDFCKAGKLPEKNADEINRKFTKFYKGKVFRIIDQKIISNTKLEQNLNKVIEELGLKKGKNDWDALHYQSIVNALAYLGGESHPIFVTADSSFANKVAPKGYRVINPMKQSIKEIKEILT
jgi:predicted nucleic acid-binding protein